MSGGKILEQIEIDLRGTDTLTVYIDIYDNSLSRKWLRALDHLLAQDCHLEKNYCFHGFVKHQRDGWYLTDAINRSIQSINDKNIGYYIRDHFTMQDLFDDERRLDRSRFNHLHRYFEDLQGVSGNLTSFYVHADAETRWHIRQLNLLCHEFESWALSYRKQIQAPEWQRPSQLMCWLNAPRFSLDREDLELFGIDTLNRPLGGVFVGVNKAVGKHHWEVFCDEGRDSRVHELVTSTMRGQTEAAGDFDIEWANNPGTFPWQIKQIAEFRTWLMRNGFDPEDPELTIGHPQIGQVDLVRTFGSQEFEKILDQLNNHLDVVALHTSRNSRQYQYSWQDADYIQRQIDVIKQGEAS
jgi:hypothetical protein